MMLRRRAPSHWRENSIDQQQRHEEGQQETKMPKRSCPFPQNCNQMKMHIDMRHVGKEAYQQEVYEKTKNLLMKGAIEASKCKNAAQSTPNQSTKGKQILGPVFSRKASIHLCSSCRKSCSDVVAINCEFCESRICHDCCRVCIVCEKGFCHVCSVINYDERDEREYCLSCST